MNKTILICLAAVVVTIVIIALAALRFLRADDADPFDEIPDEPRRARRADEDARVREAVPAAATTRRAAGRPAPAEEMGWAADGDRDRPDRRPDPDRGDRRPHRDRPDARPDRDPAGRESGFRERGTQDHPAAPDRRSGGGSQPRPVPVPAAARQAKPARPSGQGNGAPDWDTMSDVDYWTELAADKPFSTAVEAATTQPGSRRAPDQAAGPRPAGRAEQNAPLPTRSRPARPAAASAGRSAEFAPPPADSRPAHAPGRYANVASEPATQSIAALARLANQAPAPQSGGQPPRSPEPRPAQQRGAPSRGAQPRDAQPRDAQPRGTQPPVSQPRPQQRPLPVPLDDDPLTSPSFPAINTSDSRSYRASRPDTQPGHSAAAYGDPAQQFSSYPEVPARPASAPNGYPVEPAAAPVGNPYGSFVSQPAASYQAPAPTQQDASYAAYAQPVPANDGWYNAPGSGAMPPPPVPSLSHVPGYLPDGVVANGYDQAAYQAAAPETAAYHQPAYPAVQYDQGGYVVQDAAYGRDAYQGYPGYGAGGY